MGRVNVWIPDDLQAKAKEAGLSPSKVLQDAMRERLGLGPDLASKGHTSPAAPDPLAVLEPVGPLDRAAIVKALGDKVTACADGRHEGPFNRLGDYAKTCEACGQAVQEVRPR